MSELKPCPFCGGEAEQSTSPNSLACYCVECSASVNCASEWNNRPNQWVSVSDRLPLEPDINITFEQVKVLVYWAYKGTKIVDVAKFERGNTCGKEAWAAWNTYNDLNADNITHWQPLPQPPEGE